jgi:undecaprenyl-diphosphatase
LLGFLQGVFEWLPVSSEGAVAAVYSLAYGRGLDEGVEYALWLHAGTVPAALLALRAEAAAVIKNVLDSPLRMAPLPAFLIWSTAVSGVIGLPLLLAVTGTSDVTGAGVMAFIGAAMLATAAAHLLRPPAGTRSMDAATKTDAILAGLCQGVSVIPGISRSGVTLALLLGRAFQGRDALTISFLMSVPVSLAAAIYAGVTSGAASSWEALLALLVAFLTGLAAIRALLKLAARLNYGYFLLAVGAAMTAGAVWQLAG